MKKNSPDDFSKVDLCSSCVTGSCDTCGSVAPTESDRLLFSRRNFGRTVLAASAGALLVGCGKSAKPAAEGEAKKPAAKKPAAKKAAAPAATEE